MVVKKHDSMKYMYRSYLDRLVREAANLPAMVPRAWMLKGMHFHFHEMFPKLTEEEANDFCDKWLEEWHNEKQW